MKDDFSVELDAAARELPGDLDEQAQRELQSLAGINVQEPYGPQAAVTDPLGSWTGGPEDPSAEPTQDADDL